MTDAILREIQRRIAKARGFGRLSAPRWSQDWSDAGTLVDEMEGDPYSRGSESLWFSEEAPPYRFRLHVAAFGRGIVAAAGWTHAEAIARCWCAWKGIDLSDLPLDAHSVAVKPTSATESAEVGDVHPSDCRDFMCDGCRWSGPYPHTTGRCPQCGRGMDIGNLVLRRRA